jgi:hypothetical protein
MYTFNREEVAWAAGLFEGEGCWSWNARTGSPGASMKSTDEDVLRKFVRIVGVGGVHGPHIGTGKPIWGWNVNSFQQVQHLACLFWVHLGDRRKEKLCERLTQSVGHIATRYRTSCPKGHLYSPENTYYTRGVTRYGKEFVHKVCRECKLVSGRKLYWANKS